MLKFLGALTVAAALVAAGPVQADPTPRIGPTPDWVQPADAGDTAPEASAMAPVRVLLAEEQVRFQGDVRHVYARSMVRVESAPGLAIAGAVAAAWDPEITVLTVHHLDILRGDERIDALAGQTFEILRREQNLEAATLDGVLTATLQPAGLRVGDVVDFAYTVSIRDAVLGSHAEHLTSWLHALPIDRLRFRASWPAGREVRTRTTAPWELPPARRQGRDMVVELSVDDLAPLEFPADVPPRFTHARQIELTDFADWGQVAELLAPLYDRAAELGSDSPLLAEIDRIRADFESPEARAAAALRLVQDDVRYVALQMGAGGLTPASADETWRRRFGDCKGKTALLLAILHALGIEAAPAAVSVALGDGMDQRLPLVSLFDHVLVRAVIGGRVYWLDGTRTGDRSIADAPLPPYRWALPMGEGFGALVPLEQPPLAEPLVRTNLTVDASAGLDAPAWIEGEMVLTGDPATLYLRMLSGAAASDREDFLEAVWFRADLGMKNPETGMDYDEDRHELRFTIAGEAILDWRPGADGGPRRLTVPGTRVFRTRRAERQPGPYADAPVLISHPAHSAERIVVTLPGGGAGFRLEPADVEAEIDGYAVTRRATMTGADVTVVAGSRSLAYEMSFADMQAGAGAASEVTRSRVRIVAPSSYTATPGDLAALAAQEPETADAFVDRGYALSVSGDKEGALRDFERAIELDPENADAFANRGILRFWDGDHSGADEDFGTAERLDPANVVAINGRGLLAFSERRYRDAVIEFSRSIRLSPNDSFGLEYRARAYQYLAEYDLALADIDRVVAARPDDLELQLARISLLVSLARDADALTDLDALIAARPGNAELTVFRAMVLGRNDDAASTGLLDEAIAAGPSVTGYLARAQMRPAGDVEGRLADIDAALSVEPDNLLALDFRAHVELESGAYQAAAETLSGIIALQPADPDYRIRRAEAWLALGDGEQATLDIAHVRQASGGSPGLLSDLCWIQALYGANLDEALADCEAAVAADPEHPAYLDSRAFVLLQLGRPEEALAGYEAALAQSPYRAQAMYGRGLARRALGQDAEAAEDIEAALAISPEVARSFERYEALEEGDDIAETAGS